MDGISDSGKKKKKKGYVSSISLGKSKTVILHILPHIPVTEKRPYHPLVCSFFFYINVTKRINFINPLRPGRMAIIITSSRNSHDYAKIFSDAIGFNLLIY